LFVLCFRVFDQLWDADKLRLNKKSHWSLAMEFLANPRSTLLRPMQVALLEFWDRDVSYGN